MLTTMFDIKYHKKYLDTCSLRASFGSFYYPTPLFWQGFPSFFLITICSHCFQYVFMFSVWVSILSNINQLHVATYLENELGSLKLVHFETERLNRGPRNKHLQGSMLSLSTFFSWYHLKVRMPYYNNLSNKFCLYMKHCHFIYNTLRVTETGHSRINTCGHIILNIWP